MRVWRICWSHYSAAAFTGQGSMLFPGRWNPKGIPVVYAASSRALAAVEFFVHVVGSRAPKNLIMMQADLPTGKGMVAKLDVRRLPADWRKQYSPEFQALGAEWFASTRSLALQVPSAVIQGEWNVLLNPTHSAFKRVKIGMPEPFSFDVRMFRR